MPLCSSSPSGSGASGPPRAASPPSRPSVFPRGLALGLGLSLAWGLFALESQAAETVRDNYTKVEHRIPMRDGVHLFTTVYMPKDQGRSHPILMTRTPYSVAPYGEDQYRGELGPSARYMASGYIFVYQDVRGRWMSEGEFVNMRPHDPEKSGPAEIDESTDTYDTIDWLLKNVPNHNGRVGLWGISYPGFYTSTGLIDAHPALVAATPQAPIADWFVGDDFHHNGALFLPHFFNFIAVFGRPRPAPTTQGPPPFHHGTPDGYQFFLDMGPLPNADRKYFKGDVPFWNEVMQHPTYDDFWKARNLRPHLKNIKPAVMTVGGWFDAENLFGALQTYHAIEGSSPGTTNLLVMGPWIHGGWNRSAGASLGPVTFGSNTAETYREEMEFPFFERHLKDAGAFANVEARIFETGRNRWHDYDAWPPRSAKPMAFYFGTDGQLTAEPPQADGPDAFDEFESDPEKPVPFVDEIVIGMTTEYMVEDQRFASRRPDVLTYATEPLERDLTLAGPIRVDLQVATTGTDCDWIVKVIDVYPPDASDPSPNPAGIRMGGYQQLVRGDVMRGRFRNGYEKPEAFTPGEATGVNFTLNDVHHTFQPGHRLMVQVQSTWFPLVDLNPQTFVDIYQAKPEDFRKATQRVYRSKERASRVELSVMP